MSEHIGEFALKHRIQADEHEMILLGKNNRGVTQDFTDANSLDGQNLGPCDLGNLTLFNVIDLYYLVILNWSDYLAYLASKFHLYTHKACLLYTSPSPRDRQKSRMPSSA